MKFTKTSGGCIIAATLAALSSLAIVRDETNRDHDSSFEEEASARLHAILRDSPSPPIGPLPEVGEQDEGLVALGQRLFHDPSLSRDGKISCASCHDIQSGGDDGRSVSIGVGGQRGDRNAPTVLNSRWNPIQFWDGRARTLEEQVDGPIQHPKEMGMTWDEVVRVLESDQAYVADFQKVFSTRPSPDGVRIAIAEFERSLITYGSPFDRYSRGDADAMNAVAIRGYETFIRVGCITCHQGVNVGGNMKQPLGRMEGYFKQESETSDHEGDRSPLFRVPPLRNVELTSPYLHDGSLPTLEIAVRVMARYQLGEKLEDEDVNDIVEFLKSLTGNLPPSASPQ